MQSQTLALKGCSPWLPNLYFVDLSVSLTSFPLFPYAKYLFCAPRFLHTPRYFRIFERGFQKFLDILRSYYFEVRSLTTPPDILYLGEREKGGPEFLHLGFPFSPHSQPLSPRSEHHVRAADFVRFGRFFLFQIPSSGKYLTVYLGSGLKFFT